MRELRFTNRFAREFKRARRRIPEHELDRTTLEHVLEILANEGRLPAEWFEHPLEDDFAGLTECHLDPDVLLIYRVTTAAVTLHRIGRHKWLFRRDMAGYRRR